MTPDRDLSYGARIFLAELGRTRSHHERGRTVHRAGRAMLANRCGRSQRQISRYSAEVEARGRVRKVPPRRMQTPDGDWVTCEVQGYVIVPVRPAHTDLTSVSARPLRGPGAATPAAPTRPSPTPSTPGAAPDWRHPGPPGDYAAGAAAARAALRHR